MTQQFHSLVYIWRKPKTLILEDTHTPMFITALLTIHIYTHTLNGILLSHKKNKILPFIATQMDLEDIMLSKISHSGKVKYHMISLIYGI